MRAIGSWVSVHTEPCVSRSTLASMTHVRAQSPANCAAERHSPLTWFELFNELQVLLTQDTQRKTSRGDQRMRDMGIKSNELIERYDVVASHRGPEAALTRLVQL